MPSPASAPPAGRWPTDLTGKIALISRGICSFSTKIRNAQNAGAVAVLVVEQRRRRRHRHGPGRHAEPADRPRLQRLARRQRRAEDAQRRIDDDLRDARVPHHRQRRLHGRLQRPGTDRRRFPGQAGRGRAGRQRAELDSAPVLCGAALLRVLQRHVDGNAAPRRLGRGACAGRIPTGPPAESGPRSSIPRTRGC